MSSSPSPIARARASKRESGLSYVEVMAAVLVLSVALIPAIEALEIGLMGAGVQESGVSRHYRVKGRMEEMLAQPYGTLLAEAIAVGDPTAPTSFSDPVATPDRRLVYLSLYDGDDGDGDGDPFTGVDPGLLWVRVEIANTSHSLESLTTP